jgi:hypothetical protein
MLYQVVGPHFILRLNNSLLNILYAFICGLGLFSPFAVLLYEHRCTSLGLCCQFFLVCTQKWNRCLTLFSFAITEYLRLGDL